MTTLYSIFILNENKIINMNIFDKAFGRERTPNIRKRTLSNLFKDGGFPEYIIYYREAINSYNSQNYHWALINIDEAIEKSDIDDWKHFVFKGEKRCHGQKQVGRDILMNQMRTIKKEWKI